MINVMIAILCNTVSLFIGIVLYLLALNPKATRFGLMAIAANSKVECLGILLLGTLNLLGGAFVCGLFLDPVMRRGPMMEQVLYCGYILEQRTWRLLVQNCNLPLTLLGF